MSQSSAKQSSQVEIVKSVCHQCHEKCGLNVYVENGKIVRTAGMQEHQSNVLCVKGYAIPELVHSKERLVSPLVKINGGLKEVTWDEAFDFIVDKLTAIKKKYGPQAVVAHLGVPFTSASFVAFVARRFCDLYGTPNFTTGSSFCYLARSIAHMLVYGARTMPNYLDLVNTKCTMLWGCNVTESNDPLLPDRLHAEVRRGAKLIVIDPKATKLAKEAYIHAQVRPGTDCALALGMLNVIIAEGLYDKAFVEQWTVGFDKLIEHVKQWTPEKVEAATWVQAETVRNMARMYATNKPAHILQGISMDHCTNGIQANRAIAILSAITGNLDVPGGEVLSPRLTQANLRLAERVIKDVPGVGTAYPIFSKFVGEQTATPVTDQILTEKPYPVKALLIAGCNPALTWPNSNKVKRAFEKLDLLLVIDIFMTETVKMADVVLPATTLLERQEIRDYVWRGFSMVTLANRAVQPIGNSMEDWRIWAELGKRMGYAEYFPWKDSEELLEYLLKPTNVTLEQLKRNPGGIYYAPRGFRKYLKGGFNTTSGRVEIYSKIMEECGYDPLPTYHEPAESTVSQPDLAKKYPLIFVSGLRTVGYLHSEHRNIPSLRKLMPEPLLEVNPQTADSLGITNGDMVTVESLRGSIKIKAKLTEDVHPEVVMMQHGWSEANANCLTDDEARDPVSGYPGFRQVLCRVTKAR